MLDRNRRYAIHAGPRNKKIEHVRVRLGDLVRLRHINAHKSKDPGTREAESETQDQLVSETRKRANGCFEFQLGRSDLAVAC